MPKIEPKQFVRVCTARPPYLWLRLLLL